MKRRPSPSRVAARKLAGTYLNPAAKASTLEGATGTSKGTWSNNSNPIKAAIRSGELPPGLHSSWMDPRGKGPITSDTVRALDAILSGHPTLAGSDLATDMWISGWFWDFGKKFAAKIGDGSIEVSNLGRAFSRFSQRRAKGEIRDDAARRRKLDESSSTVQDEAMGLNGGPVDLEDAIQLSWGTPLGLKLKSWLQSSIQDLRTEKQQRSMEAWLDALQGKGANQRGAFSEAAKKLTDAGFPMSRKGVEKAVNKGIEQLAQKANSDRELKDILEDISDKFLGYAEAQKIPAKSMFQKKAARSIEIHDVDWMSGQEPQDDLDDDFGLSLELEFSAMGKFLSGLLGVQERVLQETLRNLDRRTALARLSGSATARRMVQHILQKARGDVEALVNLHAFDEFGHGAKVVEIALSDNDSRWDVKIDPRGEKIRFTVELAGIGEWI
jgi:hypothetical protein